MNVKNYNICDITLDTALQQFQNSGDSFPEATIIAASQLGPLLREAGNNLKKILGPGGAFHLGKKPGNFGGSKSGISDW